MTRRRTSLLIALLVASACAATAAHASLRASRAGAAPAREALNGAARQLDALHRGRSGADATGAAGPDTSQLAGLLREAATRAGATDKLASIEPGQPSRVGGDYAQTPVFLRLERLSLKQLTLALHHLAQLDPASRAQGIELSAAGTEGQTELWNADVTISYLTFAPGDARR